MTDAEQTQYNRYLAAGYDPDTARVLVERGAWLQSANEFGEGEAAAMVAEIRHYREERDALLRA